MKTMVLGLSVLILIFGPDPVCADTTREHVEIVSAADHTFDIQVAGTAAPENIEIQIENIGTDNVVNPRITVNGRYNWYTLDGLVAEITAGCESDREKAMAIFNFVTTHSYWWSYPKDRTSFNPVRHFNIYGYHICAQAAGVFTALCRAAGLEARVYEIWHHTVAEVKWDGAWHHMDPDMGVWYLKDDNRTVASIAELQANPEWVARTYKPYRWYLTPGDNRKRIYKPDALSAGDSLAGYYETAEDNYVETAYDKWMYTEQRMDLTLRPNETLVRWWKPVLRKHYDQNEGLEPPRYANGQLIFEPDFARLTYDGSIDRYNIKFQAEDGRSPAVHVDRIQDRKRDRPSRLSIPMTSPYVMVGGYIDTRFYKGAVFGLNKLSLAADLDPFFGQTTKLWRYYPWAYGSGEARTVLDAKMLRDGPQATYAVKAIYTISADRADADTPAEYPLIYGGQSGLDRVRIVMDLQVNPDSLPALARGRNTVRYTDEGQKERKVRITYRWREIHDQHPPAAPPAAVYPEDGVAVPDLAPRFTWQAAADPDGDPIVNYQFQLSLRPDCAWPISPTFDRDVRQGLSFAAPPGWLNSGTTYYWRVRAEDARGNVGPWSAVFRFKTK